VLATLIVALAAAAPAAAACPKTTLGDVEDEVMCPVCGTPLELATEAPQAQRERELIRRLVDDCRSKEEVKAVLVAELGDEVLALPGGDGFDIAAYLVPALAILLGGGTVGVAALRWRRTLDAGSIRRGRRVLRVPDPSIRRGRRAPDGGAAREPAADEEDPAADRAAPGQAPPRQSAADSRRLEADLERYDL